MAGRRMNGEGSIYQRADTGRWFGSMTLGYEDGKLVRKSVSAKTQAEVRKKLDTLRKQLDEGLPAPDDRMTVSQLFTRWHDDVLRHQVAPSAAENYKSIADNHIIPTLGRKKVSRVTTTDIDKLISTKIDSKLAVSTVRRVRSILVQALDQAVKWGVVGRNVGKSTRGPKDTSRKVGRTLTPEQARDLLEAAELHRLGALFVLMLTLGLRRGEALGLSWADLDLDQRFLVVRQAVKYEKGKVVVGDVKTPTSRRSVNIPEQLVKVLKAHRAAQAGERLKAGELWVDSGLVFTTQVGGPLDPRNVGHYFDRVCEDAGLGHWHPHELRHSAASLMLAAGVPLEVVSDVLGHASIRMTADVYGHILAPQREAAADAIAGTLWG
jgi:integrase